MIVQVQHLSRDSEGRLLLSKPSIPVDDADAPFTCIDDYCHWQDDEHFLMVLRDDIRHVVLGRDDPGYGELFAVASETDNGTCDALLLITERPDGT